MLSLRLKEIAKLIDKNKTVLDVGTDHALLPCFLVMNNIASYVYASDNKQGPLNSAKENVVRYNLEDKIELILMDGIEKCPDDVDILNINGMGFYTVKHIFENKDLHKFEKIIVQINKHPELLRQYLSDNHYTIIDEVVVKDEFYYEIEVFNTNYHDSYTKEEIEYGPINIKKKDPIFIDYLNEKIKRYESFKTNKYCDKINSIKSILEVF